MHHNQGAFGEAIANYNVAISLNKGFSLAYNNRGDALLRMGKKDEAIADFEEAIKLSPKFVMALSNLGVARYRKMEYDKAIANFKDAIHLAKSLGSEYPDAYNRLAWLLATCPAERFRDGAKAVEYAEKACKELDFKDFFALDTLGAAYAENGQFDKAVETQKSAIALLSGSPDRQLSDEAKKRIQLYSERKPYREVPQ